MSGVSRVYLRSAAQSQYSPICRLLRSHATEPLRMDVSGQRIKVKGMKKSRQAHDQVYQAEHG